MQNKKLFDYREKTEKRKIRRRLFYIIAVAAFIVLLIVILFSLVFVVRDITVIGAKSYNANEIISASGLKYGMSMISVSSTDVQKRLCAKYLYIKNISIDRKLPSTLIITVNEEYNTFYTEINGEYFLFNYNLRIIDRFDSLTALKKVREGAIPVLMNGIKEAKTYNVMQFEDKMTESLTKEIIKSLSGSTYVYGLTQVDIRDIYDIKAVYNGKVSMLFGSYSNFTVKASNVEKVMHEVKENSSGSIDVSDITRAYVNIYEE